MVAQLGERHAPVDGFAVADDVQVVRRGVDEPRPVARDPHGVQVPLGRHGPVEHGRAGRHLVHLDRQVAGQHGERGPNTVAGDTPRQREQFGNELVDVAPGVHRSQAIDALVGEPRPRAIATEQARARPSDDAEVGDQRPVVDVVEVEALVVLERGVAAAVHLPHASDAGPDAQAVAQLLVPLEHLSGQRGAGADHAHLVAEHVDQLGQLVERRLAEEAADACDAGVVLHLEEGAVGLVEVGDGVELGLGVDDHRAHLEHLEATSVAANALPA